MLSFLSAQGCPRCTLREGDLVSSASPRRIQPPLFSLSHRLPIYCTGHIALADFMTVFCGSIALVVRSLVRQYCRYAGNPTFKQPSTLFRGHRPFVRAREHLVGLGSTWLGSAPNTWLGSGPPVHRQSVPHQSACVVVGRSTGVERLVCFQWFQSLVEVEGPVVDTRAGCPRWLQVKELL